MKANTPDIIDESTPPIYDKTPFLWITRKLASPYQRGIAHNFTLLGQLNAHDKKL